MASDGPAVARSVYRGSAYVVDFVIEGEGVEIIAGCDLQTAAIIEVIERGAKTGKIGDGKIFVMDVLEAVRIRTGETGEQAL